MLVNVSSIDRPTEDLSGPQDIPILLCVTSSSEELLRKMCTVPNRVYWKN